MVSFSDALAQDRFLITTEEPPPKGSDTSPFFRRTARLVGLVDAINLTESSAAVMAMSPVGLVPGLLYQGHQPILQVTCRDRNRIALQADVLAAAALGVTTVVAMTGDPVQGGDHPQAVAVHDLSTPELIGALSSLNAGVDLAGSSLHGAPNLCIGAVVNPGAEDLDREVAWLEQKAEAGARFVHTQAVYDPASFERFLVRVDHLKLPVLATYILPRSAEMARRMNRSVPGVRVPGSMIERIEQADNAPECAIELSAPLIAALAGMCRGLHLIAVGWEARFPAILEAAGIERASL